MVFPPLYYGENREQALMKATSTEREKIIKEMDLPSSNFMHGYMVEGISTQNRNYVSLLVHILHEIKSLGFKVAVIGAGHYPLLDHARSAACLFHQEQSKPKMVVWAMSGYELVRAQFKPCGDHGGKWETSLLMYLDPGMQNLSLLSDDPHKKPVGVSNNAIRDSNAEFGKQVVNAIVHAVRIRVEDLLKNWDKYQGHGSPM